MRASLCCRVDFIGNFSQTSPIQDCEQLPIPEICHNSEPEIPTSFTPAFVAGWHSNMSRAPVMAKRLHCQFGSCLQVMGTGPTLHLLLSVGMWV